MRTRALALGILLLVGAPAGWSDEQPGASPTRLDCSKPITTVVAVAPKFPEVARKARLSMVVPVNVRIDPLGSVSRAELAPGTPDHLFLGQVAVQSAERWRFNEERTCPDRSAMLEFAFRQPVPKGWGGGAIFTPPFRVELVEEEIEVKVFQ